VLRQPFGQRGYPLGTLITGKPEWA
jgi:hypothetical protein